MKAKQAKTLSKILSLASVAAAILSFVMIFLPQVTSGDTSYNGLNLAFGKTLTSIDVGIGKTSSKIDFSFFNLLTYAFVLIGLIILALQFFGIVKKNNLLSFVATAALLAGGVMFFFVLDFSTITTSGNIFGFGGAGTFKLSDANTENLTTYSLGIGAIIGGVAAILAAVFNALKLALKK